MFKIKLTKGKTLLNVGPIELDMQDIIILIGLALLNLLLSTVIGVFSIVGYIIIGIIFRNILIAKGQIKK